MPACPQPEVADRGQTAHLLGKVRGHLACKQYEDAQRLLVEGMAHSSSSFSAHELLALLHWRSGQIAESIREQQLAEVAPWSISPQELGELQRIIPIVQPFTMLGPRRVHSLYALARQVCVDDIPGNFVECGTCRGGSAALLAAVIQRYSTRPRFLYAFDTFEGMPPPGEADRFNGVHADATPYGEGTLKAPVMENLGAVCDKLGVKAVVRPVKGLFKQTLPATRKAIRRHCVPACRWGLV